MNPFGDSGRAIDAWLPAGFARRPGLLVLLTCLLLGLAAAGWRSGVRTRDARTRAQVEALAVTSALEGQVGQAISAVELLRAVAKPSGPPIPNFQTIASELLATRPGILLQLQPRGVVSEIVPRVNNERAIGFNVLQDPAHRLSVNMAMQKRALTVAGPLTLYGGEPGMAVMGPIFQRGPDGREFFWGFAAAWMRVSEALARAQVTQLPAKGYDYLFLASTPDGNKSYPITASTRAPFKDAVQQPIRFRNLEWRLALQPRGGWVNKFKVALDCAGVIVVAGLLSLLTSLWNRQRALERAASAAARQRLQEAEDLKAAQKQFHSANDRALVAETELKQLRAALEQVESRLAESKAQFEEAERKAKENRGTAEARLKQAEARAGQLEIQLDASVRAGHQALQAHQKELGRAQAALEQARQRIAELETGLETATRAAKEAAAATHVRLQRDQGAIADLQARLEAAARSATMAADRNAAQLNQIQAENREWKARLLTAEAQVGELNARLSKTEAEAERLRTPKVKRTARNDELDLFGGRSAVEEALSDVQIQSNRDKSTDEEGCGTGSPAASIELAKIHQVEDEAADAVEETVARPEILQQSASTAQPETPVVEARERRSADQARPGPSVNLPDLRKAVHQILPLLTDQDPGAKDCFRANRITFRSAFTGEAYSEFEELMKTGSFTAALELLKKAVKRHGLSI